MGLQERLDKEIELIENDESLTDEEKSKEIREQYLHDLQWHENMNSLYTWDEGGFCDGFTK